MDTPLSDLSPAELLIIEGGDDRRVVENLLSRHKLEKTFEIEEKGGHDALRQSIYNEVNVSGRRILGILADANDNLDERWRSISDRLRQAQCEQ